MDIGGFYIKMSRKDSRDFVFKELYQMDIRKCSLDEIYNGEKFENDIQDNDLQYINSVITGISENLAEIDEKISLAVKGWAFDRISKISKAALRLAIYEIFYVDDIPESVSIYEAVELVKKYDSPKAGGFVNGTLRSIIRNTKKDEAENDTKQ